MSSTFEQIQIFYEISMSIGISRDLKKMVKTALSTYLRKMNCAAGSVLQFSSQAESKNTFEKVYSIPRNFESIPDYKEALNKVLNEDPLNGQIDKTYWIEEKFETDSGKWIYTMGLPGFGLLVLAKADKSFDNYIIQSLQQLNIKFAQACNACVQNELIQKSEEKYRTIFNSIQDVYAEVDTASGEILEISPSIKQVSGYTREEMLGRNMKIFYSSKKERLKLLDLLAKNGKVDDFEVSLVDKFGKGRCVSLSVSIVRNEADKTGKIVGTMRDITRRKRTERKLAESESRFKALANASNEAIFFSDKGVCTDQNDEAEKMFGYSQQEAVGQPATNWIVPEHRDFVIKNMMAGSEEPYEVNALRKDGTKFPANIQGKMIQVEGKPIRVTVVQDLSQLKKKEKQLRQTKKRLEISLEDIKEKEKELRLITESSLDTIFVITKTGKLTYVSPSVQNLAGYEAAEITGTSFIKYVPQSEVKAYLQKLKDVLLDKRIKNFESYVKHKDGRLIPVEINGRLIKKDKKYLAQGTMRDITERRQKNRIIKENKQRLDLALEGGQLGLWDWDIKSGHVYFSALWAKMLGYELSEIEPNVSSWEKLVHPADMPMVMKNLSAHLKGDTPFYATDHRMLSKSGDWVWIADRGQVVDRDKNGEPLRAVGTHSDITWQKQAELKLKESQANLEAVVENTKSMIWSVDRNYCLLTFNSAFREGIKPLYKRGLKPGVNVLEPFKNRTQLFSFWKSLFDRALADETFMVELPETEHGKIYEASFNPIYDDNHNVVGVSAFSSDITERKRVHQQLIRNEENQRIINYFATSIAGANTVSEILWDITYNCISRMGLEDCVIYLFNEDRSKLIQSAAYGSNKEKDYEILNPIEIPLGKGIVGHVAKTGIAEIVDDISLDERYICDDAARGSELTVPIVYEEKAIGVIDTEHSRKNFYKEHHLQIFEAISSLAANKIMRSISMEKTKESENLKSAILRSSLDALIVMDHGGRIIEFNSAAERIFGFNRDQIIGKNLGETIVPHSMRAAHKNGMKKYLKTGHGPVLGKRIEISALRASGEEFPIEIAITAIEQGDHPIFTAFIRDISERLAAEKQMRLQAATLEAAANGIIITDIQGNILWANSAMEELTGFKKEEIVGSNPRIFKSGKEEKSYYETMWNTILSGNVWQGEIRNRRKNGQLYNEETTITPVLLDDKSISNFIAIKQDITKRKKAEEILRESDRLKTTFVSNVSHELRTPLASILGFSGTIIRDKMMDDETKSEFINIIFEESQRLSRLIENVLDIARIESGKINLRKQPVLLGALIYEVVQTQTVLANRKDIKLLSVIKDNIPEIIAAPDAIKQVAVNLISNAIKFTEPGGSVDVSLSVDNNYICFTVQDTGLGIPEQDLDRIFEKFYRVKRAKREDQGTGLGLPIVKEIVEQHNGKILLKSKVGEGTSFKVLFPIEK